jgi:hypothetical protein
MGTTPISVAITRDTDSDSVLIAQNFRIDIGSDEPQSLTERVEITPGETVRVPLYFGGTLARSEQRQCPSAAWTRRRRARR